MRRVCEHRIWKASQLQYRTMLPKIFQGQTEPRVPSVRDGEIRPRYAANKEAEALKSHEQHGSRKQPFLRSRRNCPGTVRSVELSYRVSGIFDTLWSQVSKLRFVEDLQES